MPRPYATKGLPPPPEVSKTTIPMAGLLVDVYGLDELAASGPVTCLWLLHPRLQTRERMRDIACRTVHAWNQQLRLQPDSSNGQRRGLVALAFDMPNHGSRLVHETGNVAWDGGNDRHALDMLGMVKGGSGDVSALMDLVAGYLGRPDVDAHVCLGWSLGGHAAWQTWFGEERMDAAVVVVGCPDYTGESLISEDSRYLLTCLFSIGLMSGRAQVSALDCGNSPFLGSRFFPPDLVSTCLRHDPKAVLFGTSPVPSPPLAPAEASRVRGALEARRLRGKRLLLCSGGADELVPYARSAPLLAALKDVLADGRAGVSLDDRVYEGVGHKFDKDMVLDAVDFLVKAVADGPRPRRGAEEEQKARI
ncbi:hypothetical protein HJFPF1_04603 [Paramyrothecium foliicola]|nr:hypothetical protein HJFPF1_04603 [Paramyrothecium foliicola]